MDSSWLWAQYRVSFLQKQSLQFSAFFPHFSFPTTDLLLCYFQNWIAHYFFTVLSSYILSLLPLDDSSRNTCNTHFHSSGVIQHKSIILPFPTECFFPWVISNTTIILTPQNLFSSQHLLLKKRVIKRQLTYFFFFLILLLCDLPF